PAKDELIIATEHALGEMYLMLFDAQGRLVLQDKWNAGNASIEKIDLHGKPAGIYFYRLKNTKFVKQGIVVKE
ncbi:MAG: T9SS type A sorting domain-containing protein, partial [Saprospiraceae bacterium]